MTERETRVVNAFVDGYKSGEWLWNYIVIAIEDDQRYGWMSDEAKAELYSRIEKLRR